VTSQLEVFAEIGVPECCRVDFDDVDALARALADPTPLPLSCSPWTWTETAQATLGILRRVAAGKGAPHFGIRRDVDLPALRAHSAGRATTTGVEARQRRAA
jgi:hypothetical protein